MVAVGTVLICAALAFSAAGYRMNRLAANDSVRVLQRLEAALPPVTDVRFPSVAGDAQNDAGISILSIDGESYMGILCVPSVGIKTPVRVGQLDEERLRMSALRYSGTPTAGPLVILGWDSPEQLGTMARISIGDGVQIVDVDGNRYSYHVNSLMKDTGFDPNDPSQLDADLVICYFDSSAHAEMVLRCSSDF